MWAYTKHEFSKYACDALHGEMKNPNSSAVISEIFGEFLEEFGVRNI